MIVKRKAMAYITRKAAHGDELLVFSQPLSPDAGIQVPGGTLNEDEAPEDGVLREAAEETGLTGLRITAFLGDVQVNLAPVGKPDVTNHRFFFHLISDHPTPDQWRHYETDPSEGTHRNIPFDFYWMPLSADFNPQVLIAEMGALVPELLRRLASP